MTIRTIPTVWRYSGLLVFILGLLVGGTWITIKTTSDYILYQSATRTARHWAQFLAANVRDMEQIAAGETPSSASMTFFEATRKSEDVFRYTIFNSYGYSVLVSDRNSVTPVDLSEYSADAARSIKSNKPIVGAHEGRTPDQPAYFAEAFMPVLVGGRPVATVAAYVDQTDERDSFYRTFLVAAAALCLLTALSFGLPAIAWYFRTKEKQQADRHIRYLAHHDILTGLSNRARLMEKLERAVATLSPPGKMVAVHFIDIDRFKEVNDILGHDGGDHLLSTLGQRLKELTRAGDLVARLGGDEFVVVQTDIFDKGAVEDYAHRVASALSMPLHFKDEEINPRVTIGVAMAPVDGDTPARLLKSADIALYNGKAAGRNCIRFFSPDMDETMLKRLRLEKMIRDAIAFNRIVVHYQPIYEAKDKRLTGFEALVRLPAPDGSLMPPSSFIPVAQEMRILDKLGERVLREACRTAATWPSHLTVAVNLSAAQFESGVFYDTVVAALKESRLAPERLELEITETLLLGDSQQTFAQLQKLKSLGVSIVMDDFGTGYSSLRYLWQFHFNKIKIDRSFMQSFGTSSGNAETVVKTIIALGRELKMRVTIEGVETPGQAEFLHEAEADQVQGFYFGRPAPASEIEAIIHPDAQGKACAPVSPIGWPKIVPIS